jgi:signal transduction histidine kinase/ActR/RegA family two-component response regulator
VCRLGWWAVRTTASGMALIRDGTVFFANARWHQLNRPDHDGLAWTVLRMGQTLGPTCGSLREVALDEARRLLVSSETRWSVTCCRRGRRGSDQAVELRAEKITGGHGMVVLLAHDITEQVRAETELRAAQEALQRSHRMQAVGELASGLAHDMNNALNVMRMRLELFRRELPAASRSSNFEALTRLVADAAARVTRMNELSRKQSDQSEAVDLGRVIDEAISMARPELEQHSASDERHFELTSAVGGLPPVRGNPSELKHLFVNLLLNARDAMPNGGVISIDASRDGDFGVVRVRDEGTGIPTEHLEAIFQSFFTTKGTRGTGLGLSMARSSMARLGGSIVASNRPEGGAEFLLRFPLCTAAVDAGIPEPVHTVPEMQRSLRVLLVDDDPDCLDVTREVLRVESLEIDTAKSGSEALARLEGNAYDLLLCDVGMPDMSGWQVAQRARLRYPAMRIFMVTGWASEFASAESRPESVDGVIAKPVEIDELREIIAHTSALPATGASNDEGATTATWDATGELESSP